MQQAIDSGVSAPIIALSLFQRFVSRQKDPFSFRVLAALRNEFGERVRVIDLPRAGHFMLLEQPEVVTRAVAEFVGAGAVARLLLAGDRAMRVIGQAAAAVAASKQYGTFLQSNA